MTRKETKELLPIMQAFADGAEIQYSPKGQNNWLNWINDFAPSFDLKRWDYRIKPKPKYRPFKTQEECWNEMHNHSDFGWIKIKHNGNYSGISTMYKSCAEERITVANSSYTLAQALKIFTFTDGTPFGIREE